MKNLLGCFNKPEDHDNFVLDIESAREERADQILKKYIKGKQECDLCEGLGIITMDDSMGGFFFKCYMRMCEGT